jgi:hypothetical protein
VETEFRRYPNAIGTLRKEYGKSSEAAIKELQQGGFDMKKLSTKSMPTIHS